MKNYMTKEQATEAIKTIEEGIKMSKEFGIEMTLEKVLETYFKSQIFLCKGKNSCNSFVTIADACKGTSVIAYNSAKDNGAFDSGADILIAAAQLTVMASLLLVAY